MTLSQERMGFRGEKKDRRKKKKEEFEILFYKRL